MLLVLFNTLHGKFEENDLAANIGIQSHSAIEATDGLRTIRKLEALELVVYGTPLQDFIPGVGL